MFCWFGVCGGWGAWPYIGWGLCQGVWGRSGSWGPGPVHGPCLGGGGLAGSVGCCSWFLGGPLPYAYGGSVQGLPLQSSGMMRGCPCRGLPGFCAPGCWWPGSCGPLCLLLIADTLITMHGYHVGRAMCIAVSWIHTHIHQKKKKRSHNHLSSTVVLLATEVFSCY